MCAANRKRHSRNDKADTMTTKAGTMKAIMRSDYGASDVLRLEDVERPVVGDNDILVRVHAASVCKGDVHILTGKPYLFRLMIGLRRPKNRRFGQDISGRVEAIGKNVTSIRPGDDVYGNMPLGALGGFAEYACASAENFAPKPANFTYEQAAAVPDSSITALQGLRDVGKVQSGQAVLINGASGGVGTFAVQIAKALGAQVTAVCSSRHVDTVRSLGADRVVDYTKQDFVTLGQRHDAMLDLVGNRSIADCKRVLNPRGIYIACGGDPFGNWIGPIVHPTKLLLADAVASQKITFFLARPSRQDLDFMTRLIEAGKVIPVIERRYSLRDAAAAVGNVAAGHAQGKTVIVVAPAGENETAVKIEGSE
jgi:NADPH:quinone reductase-like Zn-dependent oxidoreductase